MIIETLSETECETLADLADVLIPPAPGAISASQAGVAGVLLAQAKAYAPDLPVRLRKMISLVEGSKPEAALARLKQCDPAGYDAFCETIAAIYFMSPQVRAEIGFPGREAKPARIDVAELEDLLRPVLEAGFQPRAF